MATAATQQGTAVATTRPTNALAQFREQLDERAEDLRMALPAHISPDKFQRTVVTAVQQNPDLLRADRRSLILSCMKCAQSGLLPDGREAALVIFKNRKKINGQWQTVEEVVFIEMVYGVRKKILQARDADGKPVVSGLEVNPVYRKEVEAGHFIYEVGLDPPLRHRPMLDLTMEDADDRNIVAAYSIATMADGTKSYKFMRRFQIDKIRETSKTGATKDRQGNPREASGPWVDWFPAMVEKTVLKQHAKSLPQSGDLILEADDDEAYAGRSAAAILSVPGGEPQAIEDHTDDLPDHDPETGEIIDDNADNANTSDERVNETAKTERKEQKAKARQRNAEPEKAAEQEPARDDQTGVTKDPFEEAADKYLDRFSKAETVIDLNRIHDEFDRESEGWPYGIVKAIDAGYEKNRQRLDPAKVELAK
jgi:recombination protein RecT